MCIIITISKTLCDYTRIIHVNMLLYDRILALYELLKINLRHTRSINSELICTL